MSDRHIRNALRLAESMGRKGDTILAHINPREAALLKRHGGSGKRNPRTGLLEFADDSASSNDDSGSDSSGMDTSSDSGFDSSSWGGGGGGMLSEGNSSVSSTDGGGWTSSGNGNDGGGTSSGMRDSSSSNDGTNGLNFGQTGIAAFGDPAQGSGPLKFQANADAVPEQAILGDNINSGLNLPLGSSVTDSPVTDMSGFAAAHSAANPLIQDVMKEQGRAPGAVSEQPQYSITTPNMGLMSYSLNTGVTGPMTIVDSGIPGNEAIQIPANGINLSPGFGDPAAMSTYGDTATAPTDIPVTTGAPTATAPAQPSVNYTDPNKPVSANVTADNFNAWSKAYANAIQNGATGDEATASANALTEKVLGNGIVSNANSTGVYSPPSLSQVPAVATPVLGNGIVSNADVSGVYTPSKVAPAINDYSQANSTRPAELGITSSAETPPALLNLSQYPTANVPLPPIRGEPVYATTDEYGEPVNSAGNRPTIGSTIVDSILGRNDSLEDQTARQYNVDGSSEDTGSSDKIGKGPDDRPQDSSGKDLPQDGDKATGRDGVKLHYQNGQWLDESNEPYRGPVSNEKSFQPADKKKKKDQSSSTNIDPIVANLLASLNYMPQQRDPYLDLGAATSVQPTYRGFDAGGHVGDSQDHPWDQQRHQQQQDQNQNQQHDWRHDENNGWDHGKKNNQNADSGNSIISNLTAGYSMPMPAPTQYADLGASTAYAQPNYSPINTSLLPQIKSTPTYASGGMVYGNNAIGNALRLAHKMNR
jgi:hypothetical protein